LHGLPQHHRNSLQMLQTQGQKQTEVVKIPQWKRRIGN